MQQVRARLLLVSTLVLTGALSGCGWWRAGRSDAAGAANPPPDRPPPASVPRNEEPVAAAPVLTLPGPSDPPAPPTRPLQRMPEDAAPVLEMHRNPDGPGYVVTLRAESGLPLLEPGDSRAEFERAVEHLDAVIVADTARRVEVAPGGAHDGLELPLRVFFEFDEQGRFVRTTGDF